MESPENHLKRGGFLFRAGDSKVVVEWLIH